MISNDQQLKIALRQLGELEGWRTRVVEAPGDEFQTRVEAAGIGKVIDRVREEIETYRKAKAGRVPRRVTARVNGDSCAEVAAALVQLRVAKGMRQEDLARSLEKPQPSIARWESDDYDGYTVKELNGIAEALDRQLEISFVAPKTSRK